LQFYATIVLSLVVALATADHPRQGRRFRGNRRRPVQQQQRHQNSFAAPQALPAVRQAAALPRPQAVPVAPVPVRGPAPQLPRLAKQVNFDDGTQVSGNAPDGNGNYDFT